MDHSCPRCRIDLPEGAKFCVACGADLRDDDDFHFTAPDPLIGQVVADRYHILELVGRGGMGVVYKVEHVRMGKLMAMKLLHGELARDREVVKRFKTEATAVSRLSHANTVQVFDFGRSDGLMYLIMEFIEGVELARLLREKGPLSFPRCAAIVSQVCASLAEAHDLGIIHRDLKPENVLLRRTRDGQEQVKVLDFGLAKLRETEERTETTHHGVLVGTPHYMSPEQIRGDDIDQRCDIYSLGALMFKVLSGEPPFPANTPVAVLTKHLSESTPSLLKQHPDLDVPETADTMISRCLAKSADDRYQKIDEVREELLAYLAEVDAVDLVPPDSGIMPRVAVRRRRSEKAGNNVPTETPTGAMRVGDRLIQIGSRGEFERFERSIKVKRALSWLAASLLVLSVVLLGVWQLAHFLGLDVAVDLRHRLFAVDHRSEREPNNEPNEAERLYTDVVVEGHLGKRVSLTESDRDWFIIRNEGAERRVLKAELTPIPQMDLVLQAVVFDRSGSTTIAESNVGGPGEGEAISGVSINRSGLFILVREEWVLGRPPTENVSDSYRLRAELLDPEEHEGEPNDLVGSASKLRMNSTIRGAVGEPGDVDFYCVVGEATPAGKQIRAVVRPPAGELSLAMASASGDDTATDGDEGTLRLVLSKGRCFSVRASDGERSEPFQEYEVHAELVKAAGSGRAALAPAPVQQKVR